MTNVKSMLAEVATDMPAVLISAGWISAGTSHPSGPAVDLLFHSESGHGWGTHVLWLPRTIVESH